MKLRTKLFLSVGAILLFISILSFILPNFLVERDIQEAGSKIKSAIELEEQNYFKLFSFLFKETIQTATLSDDLLKKFANAIEGDVILFNGKKETGYTKNGSFFLPSELGISTSTFSSSGEINWRGEPMLYQQVTSGEKKLILLIPSTQKISIIPVLENLQGSLPRKISINLLAAIFFSFALSLISLNQISKWFTKPIAQIANASREVSRGNYEKAQVPPLGNRKDEVASLVYGFEKMVEALAEREKIRGVLNKVVSPEIASEILKKEVNLGGEERVVTMLFSDIRGFTKMTEKVAPAQLIEQMNLYLNEMCRIIDAHRGVVDKFVGDEIMALYGAPLPEEDHPIKAIATAIEMVKKMKQINAVRKERGRRPVEIGIGIHTGLVVAGNVGSEARLNYTVLGANVNLASRLCSIAKGMQILISEETYCSSQVKETFKCQELAPVMLKGIEHSVKIFEVIVD